jgi:hypothetical protein
MLGDPEEDDLEGWFRPPWESEDEALLDPPGSSRARRKGRRRITSIPC